jgi:C-3',4' desaturase CrtD
MVNSRIPRVVIIGAGIGGLTTAAVLARAGLDVTVLEAQVYPGGCAATYFHQGYRFDAGATLAGGFYPGGPMDLVARETNIFAWPVRPAPVAMQVHLPEGIQITRRSGDGCHDEDLKHFGTIAPDFFEWQERTANALWRLALRLPPWPPQSPGELLTTAATGLSSVLNDGGAPLTLALDAFRPVAVHLKNASESLRLFVDGQLLISAQATSAHTNALYGAAALDLPRRGVVHLSGGMGAIAETLVEAVRHNGGQVLYRHEVSAIFSKKGSPATVETKRGETFAADLIIANLTPWNMTELLKGELPRSLRRLPERPSDGWGAFVVYIGLDSAALPSGYPLHHQVILGRPLGEGNSVFASLSPEWDSSRAPVGQRALTLSTHTTLEGWWDLYEHDRPAYEARKAEMAAKMLSAAEIALPGLKAAARLVIPGTPVTFQRFMRRKWGWVGGFPQTSLARSFGPRLEKNVWLVGDSIFPGQSTAAVALGGLRVAKLVLEEAKVFSTGL